MFIADTNTSIGGGITGSYNLVGDILQNGVNGNIAGVTDPLLAPLGYYGGPNDTMAILPGSLAIRAGIAHQQRAKRPARRALRLGAGHRRLRERGVHPRAVAGSTPQGVAAGDPFANPLGVTVTANNSVEPVTDGVITFTAPPTTGATAVLSGYAQSSAPTGWPRSPPRPTP